MRENALFQLNIPRLRVKEKVVDGHRRACDPEPRLNEIGGQSTKFVAYGAGQTEWQILSDSNASKTFEKVTAGQFPQEFHKKTLVSDAGSKRGIAID